MKVQETAPIRANTLIQTDYYQVDLHAPKIAARAQPGQFIHVRLPALTHRTLRRPFSIFDVDTTAGTVSVVYKIVGEGTAHLARLEPGTDLDAMGPLGNGFTLPEAGSQPVIVAGGYGCAATYLLAKRSPERCLCLFGGKSEHDVLLLDAFEDLGSEVRIATEDGSCGKQGLVTVLLDEFLAHPAPRPRIYACGPNAMLKAVSQRVLEAGLDAEVSLDHKMCCGVGACFACVVKMKADTSSGWEYVRTCTDGPVFKASRTIWD